MDVTSKIDWSKNPGVMKKRYSDIGFEKEWEMFARAAQKNPNMIAEIEKSQKGICLYCGKPLKYGNPVGHHISYNHRCFFEKETEILSPTKAKPDRKVNVPDCGKCFEENPELFSRCKSCLVVVHSRCHKEIHKDIIKEKLEKNEI